MEFQIRCAWEWIQWNVASGVKRRESISQRVSDQRNINRCLILCKDGFYVSGVRLRFPQKEIQAAKK
jgi:hypothetical protein